MKSSFLFFILLVGVISILAETEEGMVYFIYPTEPLISCHGNSTCPPGQLCHTMNYLVEHSSKFFSPDRINITLMFMCGVHSFTKDLIVQNLNSFVMKGVTESKENVIVNSQFGTQLGKPNCTIIQFFNITFVNITTVTMICPSINLQDSLITVKNSSLFGYADTKESLSFINITGRGSRGLLDNCTFKENCFIVSNFSDGILVSNSTFQSYRHQKHSIITALSSAVTLAGNVNFTNSVKGMIHSPIHSSGTAIFLITTQPEIQSSLNITAGASVYFVNLTCNSYGGAVFMDNGVISISIKAKVVFKHNVALSNGGAVFLINGKITVYGGGAIWLSNGEFNIDAKESLRFSDNSAGWNGGAIQLENGELIINANAKIYFSNNSALGRGGAVYLENTTIYVDTDTVHFYNNSGTWGGAMFFMYGIMHINSNKSVIYIMNTAKFQGGAIFIESGIHSSIIVEKSAKLLLFNNSAFQGGALYIIQSFFTIEVGYQSSVQLTNNTAFDVGGAVYSDMQSAAPCIFLVTDYLAELSFIGNYANHSIGHHMYGASARDNKCDQEHIHLVNKQGKPYCWHKTKITQGHVNISFHPGPNETLSPVSSAPRRVCLCDSNDKPQCANFSQIFTNIHVYRGEIFTLSVCIVGYDFGTTVGIVHAGFLYPNPSSKLENSQYNQPVNNSKICTTLKYTIYSKHDELLQLQTSVLPVSTYVDKERNENYMSMHKYQIREAIDIYSHISRDNISGCINKDLLTTPIFIDITLFSGCPPGLTLNHDQTTCSCYSVLTDNAFQCFVQNKDGYINWNNTVWVNATFNGSQSNGIVYNHFCPQHYCKLGEKTINIGEDPSKQCASNRTGILCGACTENFSLAIGSSRCIECSNSHNVVLLFVFAAAGVFLVFFILALNFTVTQGLINGLIFYANIVWAYKIIFFPLQIQGHSLLLFLKVFVAWLNLDLGIETCFFVGLNAFWKTWLQFLFPFYIWAIAGVIIIACRYSSRLTNLIGSRAVPLLATLFLLSYMKLLRTIIDATSVAVMAQYPKNASFVVWYLDGNLGYCHHPHIYLFIVAIATLMLLWLPYTLLLLFIQPLRRVSHLRPLKWINKLAPVYDAYLSPLKDKHQYWFGAMLLVRGILLVLLTVTSSANPELNVFMLFLFIAFSFFFISVKNVYKRMTIRVLESATLLNLIILSAGTLYKWEASESKMILMLVSIGITFVQFSVSVVWSLIKSCAGWRCGQKQSYNVIAENIDDDITHERIEDPELEDFITFVKNK